MRETLIDPFEILYAAKFWRLHDELILSAHSHLGAAAMQVLPADDRIIVEHIRSAHELLGIAIKSIRLTADSSVMDGKQ